MFVGLYPNKVKQRPQLTCTPVSYFMITTARFESCSANST